MGDDTRTVGDRGQVTIPKRLRERLGIYGGDEVIVRESDGKIVIEKSTVEDRLAEGYRQRAQRSRRLAEEFEGTASEVDELLGDAPEW